MDLHEFYTGHCFDAHRWLGAHVQPDGTLFRTFAPAARRVELVLEDRTLPMDRVEDGNFYHAWVPGLGPGARYEYRIHGADGSVTDHCDPYGRQMELRPAHRSVVPAGRFTFWDWDWMRGRTHTLAGPLNIYELHLGSWRKPGDAPDAWYRYDELAEPLIAYLKESGYNYVEFMPLAEHPCDESWGYQTTGFFAPTSRYGTPDQLKALIDRLHQNGIGAILDFVPVHFAVDAYALAKYDGTCLYEYPHSDVGHSEWGSCNFMHSRGEVCSFLQSAARYWLEDFHFDGLRMDAISRILYWQGDERRGVNTNAVEFIRRLTSGLKALHPGCILIAEDSTSYPGVTRPADQGGLGFDYKWDLGWMHDTLEYFQTPPDQRRHQAQKIHFSMHYFPNERYLLPLSHDEVVHGKATILQKMHGGHEAKFPQGRTLYLYMTAHPGKALNFMGSEVGQLREWDERRQQDWMLRKYPVHDAFYHYMARLNQLYLTSPALWAADYQPEGFAWLDCGSPTGSAFAFLRRGGGTAIAALFNFGGEAVKDWTIPFQEAAGIRLLLHTDWQRWGGTVPENAAPCRLEKGRLVCSLPACSGLLLEVDCTTPAASEAPGRKP